MEKIGMGLALCIVVGLFILMKYYDGLFHQVDNALETFATTAPTLQIRDKSGLVDVVRNGEVMFYKDDDVHTLLIRYDTVLTNATYTIELMDLSGNQKTVLFTHSSPGVSLSTDFKTILLKATLMEKTTYRLKVTLNTDTPVELPFKTGPHTFFYGLNPVSNANATDANTADRNISLGVSLMTPIDYKFNNTDAMNMNPTPWVTNSITYGIRKPVLDDFRIYTIQYEINKTQQEIIDSRATLDGFNEYMPYTFDINLEFFRTPDDMPNEKVTKPDVNCQTPCQVTITGLRKDIPYTLRARLIYFKAGTQNYRSTPEIKVTFTPTVGEDSEMSTLAQIKELLKSVKQQTVNINTFNKYQIGQDANLDDLETRFYTKYKF